MMTHVFVLGLAVQDFVFALDELPQPNEKHRASGATIIGGGGGGNAAVAVARLGGTASLGARMGKDMMGDMIVAELQAEAINTAYVHQEIGAVSGFSSIYVTPDGDRQIVNFRGTGLTNDPHFLMLPLAADAALADNRWAAGARHVLEQAKERDIPGIIDAEAPVDMTSCEAASHIVFSAQGLKALTGEDNISVALKAVAVKTSAWVCVTDGSRGVYFMDHGKVENMPAFPVSVVDTLAAGDIWHGAFALRLAEGSDEYRAMEFASAAAALKCTRSGGRGGCPDRSATEAMLRTSVKQQSINLT